MLPRALQAPFVHTPIPLIFNPLDRISEAKTAKLPTFSSVGSAPLTTPMNLDLEIGLNPYFNNPLHGYAMN